MPTRQTSSSGRPKSPRIQVVLPEDLCERLSVLAEDESRTVSNMAKVLIQQGVERLEKQRQQTAVLAAPAGEGELLAMGPLALPSGSGARPTSPELPASPVLAPPSLPVPALPPQPSAPPTRAAGHESSGPDPVPGAAAAADRFRAELERSETRGPRRLQGVPRRLRLRPPGG